MSSDSSTNLSGMPLVEHTLHELRQARKTLTDDLGSRLTTVIAETQKNVELALNRLSQDKDAMSIMETRGYNAATIKQAWSSGFGGELEKALESATRSTRPADQAQAYWEKVASTAAHSPTSAVESQNLTRPPGRTR